MVYRTDEERIWHKSYEQGVKPHLQYDQLTISQALTRARLWYKDF